MVGSALNNQDMLRNVLRNSIEIRVRLTDSGIDLWRLPGPHKRAPQSLLDSSLRKKWQALVVVESRVKDA